MEKEKEILKKKDLNIFKKEIKWIYAQAIVNNNLEKEFLKNKSKTFKKIRKILDKPFEECFVIITDFKEDKKNLELKIKKTSEKEFEEFGEMFLFYSVSLLDKMINNHLSRELEIKHKINIKEINENILKGKPFESRLGWLLKLVNGRNFAKEKKNLWIKIKRVTELRNFLIHYKPSEAKKINKKIPKGITKELLLNFLQDSNKCYLWLNRTNSENMRKFGKRVKKIQEEINLEKLFKDIK